MKICRLKRLRKIVSIMLCMALLLSGSVGNRIMAKAGEKETTAAVYGADGYTVSIEITAQWSGGYNADVKIENTSKETIRNWKMVMIGADTVERIWNAEKSLQKEETCRISNVGWNQDIEAGSSVSFGYQASCSEVHMPQTCYLIGSRQDADDEAYQIVFRMADSWEEGCIVEADIVNLTDKDIKDWDVSFTWKEAAITNIWDAVIATEEDGSYTITNNTYNSLIPANGRVTFGMCINTKTAGMEFPNDARLTHAGTGAVEEEPEVTEEMRRWNCTMMHMDAKNVQKAIENAEEPIKAAILDSGVDEMPQIAIAGRESLLSDEENTSEMYEDATGHGTALAALMVFDKAEEQEKDTDTKAGCIYEYFADNQTGDTDDEEEEDTADTDAAEENEDEILEDDGTVGLGEFIENNQADFTGINPQMELYSVQVLDEQNEAPVSRITEGIEWAIENDIKILNISVGMEKDNENLHKAIKKAYEAGILIVAATGNEGEIQYPAAYEEVIAVGSVDYTGNISIENTDEAAAKESISANGSSDYIELAAPGEGVLSVGAFGIETEVSGTSMAAGEVSAIASILWQQDASVSSHFIRELLRAGANKSSEEAGYGIVDCEYSLAIYEEFKAAYEESKAKDSTRHDSSNSVEKNSGENNTTSDSITKDKKAVLKNAEDKVMEEKELSEFMEEAGIQENTQELDTVEDIGSEKESVTEDTVSANWGGKGHLNLLKYENGEELEECLKALRIGIRLQDGAISGLNNKKQYPAWHGYYKDYEDKKSGITRSGNYIAGYLYLSALAESIFNTKEEETTEEKDYNVRGTALDKSQMNGVIQIDGIHASGGKKADASWKTIFRCKLGDETKKADDMSLVDGEGIGDGNINRALIVYGMAMHTMSDTFAHSCKGCKKEKGRFIWGSIKSTTTVEGKNGKKPKYNDNIDARRQRYEVTKQAAYNALDHIRLKADKQEVDKIKAGKIKDFCSRAFVVGAENTECEDIINVDDYMSGQKDFGEYLKEGFGVKNIYDYAKGCGAGKKTLTYLKRIDVEKIKKKIEKSNIRGFIFKPKTMGAGMLAGEEIEESSNITVMSVQHNMDTVIASVREDESGEVCVLLPNDFSRGKSYKIKYSHPNMTATFLITEETGCKEVSLAEDEEVMVEEWKLEAEAGITVSGRIVKAKADGSYGKAVEDAKVTICRQGEDASHTVATDEEGKYKFAGCIPGTYEISVKKKGYQTAKQKLYLSGRQEQYHNQMIRLLSDDAVETGSANGSVKDSFTKSGIKGLTLHIREGINEQQGDVVQTIYTGKDGSYSISDLPAGHYCVEVVDERIGKKAADKYITTRFNILIMSGKTIENQNVAAAQHLEENQMQMVLSWGEIDFNLDTRFGIFFGGQLDAYRNLTQIVEDGRLIAELNGDSKSSYGIETVKIYDLNDMKFKYEVYNDSIYPSNEGLRSAGLSVQVYYNGRLWEEFYTPGEKGYGWYVFWYDAKEGKIIRNNCIG